MQFLNAFNRFTGKWMPLVVVGCLTIGVVFSGTLGHLTFLVPFIFAFMTFTGALKSNFRQVYYVVRHPLPLAASFVLIHVVIPLIAFGVSRFLFHAYPNFTTGVVLEYVVPSAVASVMWSVMSGGNVSMTLCILIIDTLTAPFVLPISMHILLGANVHINVTGMMLDLTWMVTVPAILTMLLNQLSHDKAGQRLSSVMAPFGKIALIVIIMVNSTRIAPFILHMTPMQFGVAGVILCIAVLGYLSGWAVSALLRQDGGAAASMTFACGMRNISAGAVLAAAYFPAEVMFPVMIGTLFQQALASLFSRLLMRRQAARSLEADAVLKQ